MDERLVYILFAYMHNFDESSEQLPFVKFHVLPAITFA